jgi:nucleotide-binding universal stress UspA family protein
MKNVKESAAQTAHKIARVALGNILVPTDFSPSADHALDYALTIARLYDSRIYLAHVLTPDAYAFVPPDAAVTTQGALRQASEERLAEILISGRMRGIPHEVILEEGFLWPTIEKLLRKYEIDMVVLGTHGAKKVEKFFLGSGAEEIFRRAECPVMTVGPRFTGELARSAVWKNILFATDLEHPPERAAAYALSLAQEYQSHLTILNVLDRHGEPTGRDGAALRAELLGRLEKAVPTATALWCEAEFEVRFGSPADEILRVAHDKNSDLIVMGAHAGSGLATHNPFAKTYRVIREAACPVLTVKQ